MTQDGDEEGCLKLSALPTPEQAAVIRDVLRIRKRVQLTDEHLAALIAGGTATRLSGHPQWR